MRDVARRAGVGPSSVSRVLSGHPDVSERMREVVMNAVEELHYRPDLLARGLRSGRTGTVGFVVADISNPMVAQTVTGAERRLREAGYSMLLTNSEGMAEQDSGRIELLEQRGVDGLLLLLSDEDDAGTVAALRAARCPIVLLDRELPDGEGIARVTFDHRGSMAAATRSLLDLGHRRIGLLVGGPRRPSRERRAGVEEALAAVPDAELSVFEGGLTVAEGEAGAERLLEAEPRPTAVIAAGNVFCEGALLTFNRLGVRIPTDVSLIGCDQSSAAALHEPPISVVRRDMREFGLRAAELLISQLKGSEEARDVVLPTEFVEGRSCAPVDLKTSSGR
ncbi:MAG: LacI family DNA-binding transcriptional regulator [Actinobacteria bacterium]|nr:LacI family DNA-binding transcriptional regulator [Actinomycetota bacterium]